MWLLAIVLAAHARVAHADDIPVVGAELRIEEGELLLSAEFGFTLRSAEALGAHAVLIKKHLWDFDPVEVAMLVAGVVTLTLVAVAL